MNTYLIAGFGHLGQSVLERHIKDGDQVYTISRTALYSTNSLHKHLIADLDSTDNYPDLPESLQGIYYFAPPPESVMTDTRLEKFLNAISGKSNTHFVYVSTSGVYGNQNGEWVSEETPLNPQTRRAKRRLSAEQIITQYSLDTKIPVTILRVGGIYSSKTISKRRLKASERPVICPEEAPYTNRIHVTDLATICTTVMNHPPATPEIYNVSDGNPATTTEFSWKVNELAGLPRQDCVSLDDAPVYYSDAYMSYLLESRRMDTSKLFKAFKIKLQFANYEDGIIACLEQS